MDLIFEKFDEDPGFSLESLDIAVNAVATAVKDFFFKRLPPLLPQVAVFQSSWWLTISYSRSTWRTWSRSQWWGTGIWGCWRSRSCSRGCLDPIMLCSNSCSSTLWGETIWTAIRITQQYLRVYTNGFLICGVSGIIGDNIRIFCLPVVFLPNLLLHFLTKIRSSHNCFFMYSWESLKAELCITNST